MFAEAAVITPVIVAPLMTVVSVRKKSSAVSVANIPELSLWESAPSRPSALPVVKEKGLAQAGVASTQAVIIADIKLNRILMSILLVDTLVVNHQFHGCSYRSWIRRDPCLQRLTTHLNLREVGKAVESIGQARQGNFTERSVLFRLFRAPPRALNRLRVHLLRSAADHAFGQRGVAGIIRRFDHWMESTGHCRELDPARPLGLSRANASNRPAERRPAGGRAERIAAGASAKDLLAGRSSARSEDGRRMVESRPGLRC